MALTPDKSPKLTPAEYFDWEEQQPCRHEYINGEVYAMGGGTQNHSRIALKCAVLLENHLPDGPCRVFNSDCRVNIVDTNDYTYPDVSVSCDPRDKTTTQYICPHAVGARSPRPVRNLLSVNQDGTPTKPLAFSVSYGIRLTHDRTPPN